MKTKELLKKAEEDIKTEQEEAVIKIIKTNLKNIASCERTLNKLKKVHEELMNTEVNDLELDSFEY